MQPPIRTWMCMPRAASAPGRENQRGLERAAGASRVPEFTRTGAEPPGTPTLPRPAGRSQCVDRRTGAGQPMGWEALAQWGDDVARIAPLAGGVANDVWSVRVNGRLAVGRLGARSDADLAWETALLQHLDRAGLIVPVPIPTADGRLFADGVVVMTYVGGRPPETEADWRRVADTLRQL